MRRLGRLTLLLFAIPAFPAWAGFVVSNGTPTAVSTAWIGHHASVLITEFSCLHRPAVLGRSLSSPARVFGRGGSTAGAGSGGMGAGGAGAGGMSTASGEVASSVPNTAPLNTAPLIEKPPIEQASVVQDPITPFTPGIDDQVEWPTPSLSAPATDDEHVPQLPSQSPEAIDEPITQVFPEGIDDQITRPFTPGIDDQVFRLPVAAVLPTPGNEPEFNSPAKHTVPTKQIVAELARDPMATKIDPGQQTRPQSDAIANAQPVPEPGTLALLILGLLALGPSRLMSRGRQGDRV